MCAGVASLRRIARTGVHGNVVIATAASAVALTSFLLVDAPVSPNVLVGVFVVAWFVYTVNRFTDRDEDGQNLPGRARFVERYGLAILGIAGMGYVGVLGATAWFVPRLVPLVALPIVGVAVYATWPIKRLVLLKNVLVGAVWALIPIGLGVYLGSVAALAYLFVAAVVFWHITLAAVLFDIKDIDGDRVVGARTVPIVVGPERTRHLVAIAALPLLGATGWAVLELGIAFAALGIYPLHLMAVSHFARVDRGPLFYGLVIDGEHVVVAIVGVFLLI